MDLTFINEQIDDLIKIFQLPIPDVPLPADILEKSKEINNNNKTNQNNNNNQNN